MCSGEILANLFSRTAALVLSFDGETFDSSAATSAIERFSPDLALLVCELLDDGARDAVRALCKLDDALNQTHAWCVTHACELVELSPSTAAIDEALECNERYGVARLLQALESHAWENARLLEHAPVDRGECLSIVGGRR